MAKGLSLKALLALDTKQFNAAIKTVQGQIASLGNYMKSAFAIGSVAMFGRGVIIATKNFEDAMARAKAVSNATTDGFRMMEKEALRLGATTRYTATQVAETLEVLTRNGMSAEKATKSLASVLQLAQANAVGLADAGNMMTNTLNMFGLSVKDVQRVNDVLSSIASNTATNLQDLYDALVNAAPMAHALGVSIEETTSALGALAQRGLKGADAGTQLRMALQKMVDPSAMKKMEKLGIHIDEATIKADGLQGVLKQLSDANLSVSQLNEIFTVRSSKAVLQLVNSFDDFNTILDITRNSAGTAFRMFEEGVGSVRKELDVLRSVWENFLISFGNDTSGPIKAIIRGLQNAILAFKTFGGKITNIITLFTVGFSQRIAKMAQSFGVFSKANELAILSSKRLVAQKEIEAAQIILKNKQSTASEIASAQATVDANRTEIVAIDKKIARLQALQIAYKMVLGAVIVVAAVVVEQLVAGIINANRALKDANTAIETAARDSQNLTAKVGMLKDMIGNGEDKESLAAAVTEATRTFSEFSEQIKNAYKEAGKTGNYEKLKNLLDDIAKLQTTIMAQQANQELVNATRDAYVRSIRTRDDSTSKTIRGSLKNQGFNKEGIDAVYNNMADILIRNHKDLEKATKELSNFLSKFSIQIDYDKLHKWIKDITPSQVTNGIIDYMLNKKSNSQWTNAVNAYDRQQSLTEQSNTQERDIKVNSAFDTYYTAVDEAKKKFKKNSKDYEDAMRQAASNLKNAIGDIYYELGPTRKLLFDEIQEKWGRDGKESSFKDSGSGSKKKTDWDKFTDELDDYNKKVIELKSQLKNGAITQEEYDNSLLKLRHDTWLLIAGIDELDRKMVKLSQSQKDAIKDVNENFPKKGETGNDVVELAKILKQYQEKKGEINAKRDNGEYKNLTEYLTAINKLEDETWNSVSALKGLEASLEWLPNSFKKLFDEVYKNAKTNNKVETEKQKIEIEAHTTPPTLTAKNEKEFNEKSNNYKEIKSLLQNYLKNKVNYEGQAEKGNINTGELQRELDRLDNELVHTLLMYKNVDEVIGLLPESYKQAARQILDASPKNLGDLIDKVQLENILDDFSTESGELLKKKIDGSIDENDYKRSMEQLSNKTLESTKKIKGLSNVIDLLPPVLKDVYRKLNEFVETFTKSKPNNENENPYKQDELPKLKEDTETVPVNIEPIVSVDIDEKEIAKNIKVNVNVDKKNDSKSVDTDTVDQLLKRIERALKGDKQFEIDNDLDEQESQLKIKLSNVDQIQSEIQSIIDDLNSGSYEGIREDALQRLYELEKELIKCRDEADNMNQKLMLSQGVAKLKSDIEDFKQSALDNLSSLASAFDRIINGVEAIYEAFGEEIDMENIKKAISVLNGVIQVMEAIRTIITLVKIAKDVAAKKAVANAGAEAAANLAVAASEGTKAAASASAAAAEGASSVAGVPIAGPALAVAAVAAIVAALVAAFASLKKFETGGIVGGNSTSGDRNIVRANSGEMILNKHQQSTLYNAIASGKLATGGAVEFKIRGADLVGVISNYNKIWK